MLEVSKRNNFVYSLQIQYQLYSRKKWRVGKLQAVSEIRGRTNLFHLRELKQFESVGKGTQNAKPAKAQWNWRALCALQW